MEVLNHSGGPSQLLHATREKYWITNARNVARKVIDGCIECKKDTRQCFRPAMANLHPTRLGGGQDLRAFKNVGIDVAGPFVTKQNKGKNRMNKVKSVIF